jgi:hypothetical protein
MIINRTHGYKTSTIKINLPLKIYIFESSFVLLLDLIEKMKNRNRQKKEEKLLVPNSSKTKISPFCVVHLRIFCNSINSLKNKYSLAIDSNNLNTHFIVFKC